MEWIDEAPRTLGAVTPATAENAIELATAEIPCYSRLVDDCLSYNDENQKVFGLATRCQRINELVAAADETEWQTFIDALPYCEGYFDYKAPKEPQRGRTAGAAAVGLAVGMVIGIVLG